MKRHRQHAVGRQPLHRESLRKQQGQWSGKPPPALVLEALDRDLDRTLVGDRRAQPRQRPEAAAAPALSLGRLELDTAAAAHRFLETPDPALTALAEPRTDGPACSAPGRQHKVDELRQHESRLSRRVKRPFT